jgi:hypothetical protein
MAPVHFTIRFPEASPAEANQLAGGLADVLRDLDKDIEVERKRDQPDTQDFGGTLVIVLGSAAATAIAKGIAAWLSRNGGPEIEISSDGHVIGRNLGSGDAARIAEAFYGRH